MARADSWQPRWSVEVQDVIICGSTGSIGTQTLEVIRENPTLFRVVGLSVGGSQPKLLAAQVAEFSPRWVAIADEEAAVACCTALKKLTSSLPEVLIGADAATELATKPCDVVVNAITGAAGLLVTLATLERGTRLALANKESLVIGGRLVTDLAADNLVAIDSEHSAIAQALRAGRKNEVSKVILTASGGPFRGRTRAELTKVTSEQAMAHPTWQMGRVITINSSTLVNKGLELLEAGLLYDVDLDDITVVVHPQSVVHSGVEYLDGASILQASPPDMKLPIGLALTWPDRLADVAQPVDWTATNTWTFEPLDDVTFPAVQLARRAGKAGGTAPAVYNASNEVCVDEFCEGRLSFLGITDTIERVLELHLSTNHVADAELTLEAVLAADAWARSVTLSLFAADKRSAHEHA